MFSDEITVNSVGVSAKVQIIHYQKKNCGICIKECRVFLEGGGVSTDFVVKELLYL